MSGEIFRNIVEMLEQSFDFPDTQGETHKVILGAPLGDVHDIGKDIVSILLRCRGFQVIDLGVSVSPDRFMDAAQETGARLGRHQHPCNHCLRCHQRDREELRASRAPRPGQDSPGRGSHLAEGL